MVKKGGRATIPTFSVQMPTDELQRRCPLKSPAFTLTELVVVILMISLIILLAGTNLYGLLVKSTFRGQIQEIVSTMQMAANSAAETSRRYEIIFDLDNQSYILREITSTYLPSDVLEEEIITSMDLPDSCRIAYVIFDDGNYTNQGRAMFRVGRSSWQCGGKIVFTDAAERPYSIIVNRLNRNVTLRDGDIDTMMPKSPEDMAF